MPNPRLAEVGLAPPTSPERLSERVRRLGPTAISDDELLAALIGRQGPALPGGGLQGLLEATDGLVGLAGLEITALRQRGLSSSSALRVAVTFELSRRLAQANRRHRHRLISPEDVMQALGTSMAALPHEELWLLPLDPQSRLIGEPRVVSRGDVDGTDAGPRAFFRLAVSAGATSAIAVHNHPSGEVTPSAADAEVTRRLVRAGATIDVLLADHLIVGQAGCFTSLRRTRPELFRP